MPDLLRVENLAKRFGGIVATDNLDLAIPEGELELAILFVEHDMEAVFALADRITVLARGRVIASGQPAAIRNNAQVRDAYLGEQEAVHG